MLPERKRNRLFGFDYGQDAFYFFTSCVKEMACAFGEVVNEEMYLNEYGQIAQRQWGWLLEQNPYLNSHAFVVMPNHIHAILELNREEQACGGIRSGREKIKSLSQIMGAYKTITSKLIRQAGMPDFAWHRSFHDHIIRDGRSFHHIKNYIENNPANWNEDTFRR